MQPHDAGKSTWRRWADTSRDVFERAFYRHGLFCATNPFVVIVAVTVIGVCLSWPSLPLLFGSPQQYGSLQYNVWNADEEVSLERSSLTPPAGVPKWIEGVEPVARVLQVDVTPREGHAMQRRALRKVGFELPRLLSDFSTTIDGNAYSLSSFCVPESSADGAGCLVYHPGLFWSRNETAFDADQTLSAVQAGAFVRHPGVDEDAGDADGDATAAVATSATAAAPAGVLRSVLLKNLRGEHGINYVSADTAVVLVVLRHPATLREALHEQEFFRRLWQRAEGAGVRRSEGPTASKHTYLRYRKPSSSSAEQAYLGVVYSLVFFYVYFTVARFESVKSKIGLAVAAVMIIFASTLTAIGLCQSIGLITTVTAVEVLPFLIVAIGLDNITVVTDSVVSKWGVATRFQVAEGLAAAGPQLMRSLLSMEGLMLLGVYSRIPALQEFCAIVSISLLCEFALEMTLYVSVLSVDIRRVELADFFAATAAGGGEPQSPILSSDRRAVSPLRLRSRSGGGGGGGDGRGVGAGALSLPLILSVLAATIIALIGGVSNVADKTYEHSSIPSLLVDWRYAVTTPGAATSSRPTLVFLPPLAVTLDAWGDGAPPPEEPVVWVPTYFEGSRPASNWVSSVLAMLALASGALMGCWAFQLPSKLNSMVFGRHGVSAAAFNAFGQAHNFELATFVGHEQEIECVAVIAAGEGRNDLLFATACLGGEIRVWDQDTNRCVEVLVSGHHPQAGPAEKDAVAPWCLAAHQSFVVAGYASGVVKVWDLSTHLVVTLPPSVPLPGEGEPGVRDGGGITAVCFFDDSLVTASSTGVLQQWHFRYTAPGQPLPPVGSDDAAGHTELFLPRVASLRSLGRAGSSDNAVCSRCGSHNVLPGGQLTRSGVPFVGLGPSPASPKFTLGDGDADDGGAHGAVSPDSNVCAPVGAASPLAASTALTFHRVFSKAVHKSAVSELVAAGGQLISTSRDNLVKLYDRDLKCVRTLYGHEDGVTCVALSGGSTVVSGSRDKTVRVWRATDGHCENVFSGHTDAVLSVCGNGSRVVSCSEDDTIRIWSRSTGRCTQVLRDSTMAVALHPSSVLITASEGALTAWNLHGHVERLRTVSLLDENVPSETSALANVSATRHLVLCHDTVICDLGHHVKTVKLPFPPVSAAAKDKEP